MAIIFATHEKWFDGNLMGQTIKYKQDFNGLVPNHQIW